MTNTVLFDLQAAAMAAAANMADDKLFINYGWNGCKIRIQKRCGEADTLLHR